MGLVKTNDNCIGCNRCIKVCSSMGANVAVQKGKDNIIDVDPKRCIACGACVYQCPFGAIMDKSYMLNVIDYIKNSDENKKYKVYSYKKKIYLNNLIFYIYSFKS